MERTINKYLYTKTNKKIPGRLFIFSKTENNTRKVKTHIGEHFLINHHFF